MDFIIALITGGVVGWLASIVMRTNAQMGLLANIVIGVVGSLLGAWIANAFDMFPRGGLAAWAVSILGAMLLIAILRAVGVFSRPASAS